MYRILLFHRYAAATTWGGHGAVTSRPAPSAHHAADSGSAYDAGANEIII